MVFLSRASGLFGAAFTATVRARDGLLVPHWQMPAFAIESACRLKEDRNNGRKMAIRIPLAGSKLTLKIGRRVAYQLPPQPSVDKADESRVAVPERCAGRPKECACNIYRPIDAGPRIRALPACGTRKWGNGLVLAFDQ